jgi:uncharacterized protein (UPF0332 family)
MNEQTKDFIQYRLKRAKETIIEIDLLIDVGHWNTVANRMYYACFYSVGALLLTENSKASTHSGNSMTFLLEREKLAVN